MEKFGCAHLFFNKIEWEATKTVQFEKSIGNLIGVMQEYSSKGVSIARIANSNNFSKSFYK